MIEPEEFQGRRLVDLDDGREAVLYDPTEAVEEWAEEESARKRIGALDGGIEVDQGEVIEQDEDGQTGANSSGTVVAVPKRGQEEIFAQLKFSAVLPVSAGSIDEAMDHARRHLLRAGLSSKDFLSFNMTTHYYQAALGKRECGWSFAFEQRPQSLILSSH